MSTRIAYARTGIIRRYCFMPITLNRTQNSAESIDFVCPVIHITYIHRIVVSNDDHRGNNNNNKPLDIVTSITGNARSAVVSTR